MGFQDSPWNISVSSLVILVASVFDGTIVRKKDRHTWYIQTNANEYLPRDCRRREY